MEERIWHKHYDFNVQTEYRHPRFPTYELLNMAANVLPDKAAVDYYGAQMTFHELKTKVLALATMFEKMGIQKGDRIGLHLPNIPEYVICFYAAGYVGAVVVNFNPLYTVSELTQLVTLTGLDTIVTFDAGVGAINEVAKAVDIPHKIAVSIFDSMGGDKSTPDSLGLDSGWEHFHSLLAACEHPRRPRVKVDCQDPAVIQFTGGTTGIPKGAVLTHYNIVSTAFSAVHWGAGNTGYTPVEKRTCMCALPFFHVYGNIIGMNWSMINCATMILVPKFEIEPFMDLLANTDHITFFPAVPTMISAVVNHPKAAELALDKKIRLLNSGGAPIPQELMEKTLDTGLTASEGWGMSETTSLGVANPILGLKKVGSIGIPFPGMDVRLVDVEDRTREVAPGEAGELLIKGPFVMDGYFENPEQTAREMVDGWLCTGDVARMDEDGYLFIVDRKKDMVIAGGYNIYPRDIDEVLYQNPKVAEAVAVGVRDEYRGETVKAYVVLRPGEAATEKEIIDFCREKLAVYKVPKIVEFREELPKSSVGKILRRILREEEDAKLSS
ncbi:MAG TPA: long-chain fatty acid--CoA ligase [Desulfobacteraceae bacterium]|nr:long-chain fatty acid--CoA ligase [Desulfobacteraceae bacterium]